MILSLDFKFDAAHRLMNYKGLCSNIHGHTWKVRVNVRGILNPETDMVADFKDLNAWISPVIDMFDHSILLNCVDKVLEFCKIKGFRVFEFFGDPTCETIASFLYQYLSNRVPANLDVKVDTITVWESEKASATVYK